MVILNKYKLIFLKTTKTAGTSIEVFLSRYSGENDILTPVYPVENNHYPKNYRGIFNPFNEIAEEKNLRRALGSLKASIMQEKYFNHMSAVKLKNRVKNDVWNNYYKFAVERNPWDKVVSWYNMVNTRKNLNIDFSSFIRKFPLPIDSWKYMDSKRKNIIIDKIVLYENLNSELKNIFDNLGIEFLNLNVKAKYNEKKRHMHYSEYYKCSDDIEFIGKKYKKEISLFNYEFGGIK